MVCSFLSNDDIYEYISNMGNNLTPYSIAAGFENIYFLTPHFKIFRKHKIDSHDSKSRSENSLDPYDYHVSNCGNESFKNYETIKIHQIMIKFFNFIIYK